MIDVAAPLLLVAVAVAYARRVSTLARRGQPVNLWRQVSFAAGVLVLLLADVPPISTVAEELVVAHMAQHLLIADLAGLLVALGLTGPIMQPLLATRALGWLRVMGNPLVALPFWALNLYLWHLSALYQGVLTSPLLHFAQHVCFFSFGLAMWLPLVGPLPKPSWFGDGAKLLYVIVVRLLEAVLANILIWSGTVLYPDYAPTEADWDISPLADQGAAGNLMMIWTGVVTLGLFTWLFIGAANRSAEKQELIELAEAHGVELDPARAGPRGRGRPGRAPARADPRGRRMTGVVGSNRFLYALVFVVGISTLGAEIAAARLMAPFFGASTIVWANTIGVVLVALSIGYWLGGRLGDRYPSVAQPLPRGDGGGAAARPRSPRRPAVLRPLGGRPRRDRGGRLHRLAVRGAGADRRPGRARRHVLAMGDPARRPRRRAFGARRRAAVRDLDRSARCSGPCSPRWS